MSDYELALTITKADPSDFSSWLGPNSRLPADIVFHVQSVCSTGHVLSESIPAHKAVIAKAIPVFEELFFHSSHDL